MISQLLRLGVAAAIAVAGIAQEGQRTPVGPQQPALQRGTRPNTDDSGQPGRSTVDHPTPARPRATGEDGARQDGGQKPGARPGQGRHLFDLIDANNDGMIDDAEVARFRAMVERVVQEARARQRDRMEHRQEQGTPLRDDRPELRDDRQELQDDREDLRDDRTELRDDHEELRDDRQELRDDLRDNPQDVRQDVRELRQDHQDVRDDRADLRDDHQDLRQDRRDLVRDRTTTPVVRPRTTDGARGAAPRPVGRAHQ